MNEQSMALPNALELASDLEDDNFRGSTTQIVNIIRDLAVNYGLSRRDYEVMSRLCVHAEKLSATMTEWMKTDMTGDSDYPTTFDCFVADHPEIQEMCLDRHVECPNCHECFVVKQDGSIDAVIGA